ncbi:ABC transporter substrate-binding protein [Paenibacillus thermotolerans]|uniref:ABC transporter substrate-binding protein n=1 Tax=Paenibacillus thermotolerans TaxID=3027807 RepID=UPI002368D0B0|nr:MULTISPECIES: ABC transporter substrate-binding protein [unclassified Paenibacillus]
MSMKKSILLLLAMMLTMSLFLGACSSNGSSGGETASENEPSTTEPADTTAEQPANNVEAPKEKVELEFWAHWGSVTRRPIIEKIVSDFNGSQDRIHVKYVFLPYGDIWTKELAQIAAGNPPDAIINEIAYVGQRAQKKQVMNLQKYVEQDNMEARFHPHLWEIMKYEGDVYALPFNTDTRMLFYNKKMFTEAGLDPEKPPKTWDELEVMAQKLDIIKNGKIERLGYHPRLAGGHEMFLNNADGGKPWLDSTGVHINTPNKVAAMKWFLSWDERYGREKVDEFRSTFGSKTNDPLIAGKLGMKVDNGTFWTQIRDFAANRDDFGIAPMPEYKEGSGHWSNGGGFTIEIPYGAKHPDESWEFLKYMTDVAAQKYWAQYNFDNVANIEASNDPDLLNDPIYKATVENLKTTVVAAVPVEAPDFASLVNPEIDAILLGQQSPEDGLAKAQAAVEDLIESNK